MGMGELGWSPGLFPEEDVVLLGMGELGWIPRLFPEENWFSWEWGIWDERGWNAGGGGGG